MLIPWLVVGLVTGLAAWFGAARMAARDGRALTLGLILPLVAGGLCWMIAEGKSGGFMAGIIGVLFALLLFIATGAVVLGAALRRVYEWWRPPAELRPAAPGWLGMLGMGLFCVFAVLASALE